jgi:hypothetical protein
MLSLCCELAFSLVYAAVRGTRHTPPSPGAAAQKLCCATTQIRARVGIYGYRVTATIIHWKVHAAFPLILPSRCSCKLLWNVPCFWQLHMMIIMFGWKCFFWNAASTLLSHLLCNYMLGLISKRGLEDGALVLCSCKERTCYCQEQRAWINAHGYMWTGWCCSLFQFTILQIHRLAEE